MVAVYSQMRAIRDIAIADTMHVARRKHLAATCCALLMIRIMSF